MNYSWIIFALLSAATAALVGIFGKIGLEGIDSNTATAIRAVIMTIFLVGVVIVSGKLSNVSEILANQKAMLYIVLSGIMGALSWLFYFVAIKMTDVSKVVPIDRLSVVFAIILAFLILGEKITWAKGIGAALITAGAIMIAIF
ncbi:MAG: EamA family transporter [Nanoarchaeota archaeon]|nr:EamA family transporter [Nanoarchaeota archaeon]